MKLKINGAAIIKFLIFVYIFLQLSYVKLLGKWFPVFSFAVVNGGWALFYLIFIAVILLLNMWMMVNYRNVYLRFFPLYVFGTVTIAVFLGKYRYDIGIGTVLIYGVRYLYVFLAIPIFNLLCSGKWKFKSFLKSIVWLTEGSFIIRTCISMGWSRSGKISIPAIALEYALDNWIRNGILRVNPPALGLIIIPILYYLISESRNQIEKVLYGLTAGFTIWYTFIIHASRSVFIYYILTIIFMWMIKKTSELNKILKITGLLITSCICINLPAVEAYIGSFASSTKGIGRSTYLRILALEYYGRLYLEHPILGIGFISAGDSIAYFGAGLADIGFFGTFYKMGILAIVMYALLFGRGVYIARIIKAKYLNESRFILGMLIGMLMTGINIDCFYGYYAFAVPFYIAICEYVYWKYRNNVNNVAVE